MNTVKKTLLLILMILLVTAFGIGAAAADKTITVDVPNTQIPYNGITTIPVTIHDAEKIAGLDISIYNESSGISIKVNTTEPLGGNYEINNVASPRKMIWFKSNGITATEQIIFYIDVDPSSLPVSSAWVNISICEISNESSDITNQYTAVNGSLQIQRAPSVATSVVITTPTNGSELPYLATGTAVATVYDQYGDVMPGSVTWTSSVPSSLTIDSTTGAYTVNDCSASTAVITASVSGTTVINTSTVTLKKEVPVIGNLDISPAQPWSYTYDGAAHAVSAAAKPGLNGFGAVSTTYNGSAVTPVTAGTYKVNASIAAGNNYSAAEIYLGDLTISKAVPTIANLNYPASAVTEDYNGQTHSIAVSAKDGINGLGAIKVKYNDAEAEPASAGTYAVNVSIAEGTNYTAVSNIQLVNLLVINPAVLTKDNLTTNPALPMSYEFDNAVHEVTVSVKDGIYGAGTFSVKYNGAAAVPIAKGTYQVNASFTAGNNYTATEIYLGDLTITGRLVTEPTVGANLVYNGAEQSANIAADSLNYTITNNKSTAAGTYTATVKLVDKTNTAWRTSGSTADLSLLWTIDAKSISSAVVNFTPNSYVYDGSVKEPVIVVKDGNTVISTADYEISGDNKSASAGSHVVTVTGKNNYTGTVNGTWVINKAKPVLNNINVTPTLPQTYVYDGTARTIAASAKTDVYGMGSIDVTYNGSATAPSNASTYKVNATIAEGSNYTAAEISLGNLIIDKTDPMTAVLSYPTFPVSEDYNGQEHKVTVTAADGVVGLGAVTVKYNGTATAPTNVGTYAVNVSVAAGDNYNAAADEFSLGNLVINKITPSTDDFVITPSAAQFTGGNIPVTVTPKYSGMGDISNITYNNADNASAIGVYTIRVNVTDGTNYNSAVNVTAGTFEITAVPPTPVPPRSGGGSGSSSGYGYVTYEVSFDSQGGSAVDKISNLNNGAIIKEPVPPTKSGYKFEGWYTADGNKWDFQSDKVTKTIILYAKWNGASTVQTSEPAKPATTTPAKTPVPFAGLVIGLGAAALLIRKIRN